LVEQLLVEGEDAAAVSVAVRASGVECHARCRPGSQPTLGQLRGAQSRGPDADGRG
jgi:hypothetical protein